MQDEMRSETAEAARTSGDTVAGPVGAGEEPRWLDAEEQEAFMALMSVVLRLETALDAQLRTNSGISHFEYSVIATLSEAPEQTLRMGQLAHLASGSLPRLSQVVGRLERRGWVRRTPCPEDRRAMLATLTEEGRAAVVAAAPGHVAEVRRLIFDPLTRSQVRQLATIGRRIMSAVDPEDRCLG